MKISNLFSLWHWKHAISATVMMMNAENYRYFKSLEEHVPYDDVPWERIQLPQHLKRKQKYDLFDYLLEYSAIIYYIFSDGLRQELIMMSYDYPSRSVH